MDVLCLVADCIVEFLNKSEKLTFTVRDIWYDEYTVENVQQIFRKPNPSKKAANEYDKYFGQPIKLLDNAGIIRGEKTGARYIYEVINYDLLEYISFRERNAYNFLSLYIEKVLRDSEIYHLFEYFFNLQDKESFKNLKDGYTEFTIEHTPINGSVECGRIFTKVLNPLAYKYKKHGTEKGHISKDIVTQDMLMYNQRNWRDVLSKKPKDVARIDYEVSLSAKKDDGMTTYRINRAKKNLRRFNDKYRGGLSELKEERHLQDLATQMHHIFPASSFPGIADFLENLIALTPTQHFNYAHPNNNTQYIDKDYQYLCLVAKTGSIRDNILRLCENEPVIYDFSAYQTVLNTGLKTDEFNKISNNDFEAILDYIDKYY